MALEILPCALDHDIRKFLLPIGINSGFSTTSNSSDEATDSHEDDDEETWVYPEDCANQHGVDAQDEGTSDNWIRRNPELIRLTGRHPFNSEPPLTRLMECGFLTPTSLHYVRNHGYVPQAVFDEWTVEVCGLVERPQTFRMCQITQQFKPRELPVTLVCAGNRRKEQNMVKQSRGFNWGSAAISTSVWRGARLCDVLVWCGIVSKRKGAMYVCLEGGEMLPAAGGSKYGTSISADAALDEAQDILLAYMQNGKLLEPDHGFPVRMIVPGYIGGRMVKWLTRIEVTSKESENYYHYHDNRVLPSHVDAEIAKAEGWWYKPEYVINELNINSVITTPAHAEVLPTNGVTLESRYTLHGYAYTGGGRKVIRVEVTMDNGQNWMFCSVTYPNKPTKYGKYWCWCFWQVEVKVMELMRAKELAVRAWDAAMNTQPEQLIWNVMGMMNNCWFRVKVEPCQLKDDGRGLVFQHPTRPGNQREGWMVPQDTAAQSQDSYKLKKLSSLSIDRTVRQIHVAELKLHNTPNSPWIVVNNNVYDCTKFLNDHPGGRESILINAGSDCTEEFSAIHSTKAKSMLEDYKIGELAEGETAENSAHDGSLPLSGLQSKLALRSLSNKINCKLVGKKVLSHDVRLFKFSLPSEDQILGLPVGKHILVLAKIKGKLCSRPYTPTSSEDEKGYFELLVRIYFQGIHSKFVDGGLMSQYLDSLVIGDTVDVSGPLGHIHYVGKGHFTVRGKPKFMKQCAMLAGGTGITPIYQIIQQILKDPEDRTQMSLLFANRTEEDIMLRSELDKWAEEHSNFRVWYAISRSVQNGWKYSRGHINEQMVKEHLPSGSDPDTMAFLCGPASMMEEVCFPNLENHGYNRSQCFQF